ncbi:hypothetical protein Agabi119p4_7000 [Agaricus bisporus var. burnettii]|uniref:Uncharacterized protein n=2 Tax=Agaricus bisporus TaxID=5341 RepID=A0A8H7F0L3_AGABI|nr:hypothetical protein Agabi119p4_7000 [Agaricus bisporus var. burnettii]
MPPLPVLPRARPSKAHLKFRNHAWRQPWNGTQIRWALNTLRHLRHSPLLPPDAWLPLADFATQDDFHTVLALTDNDRARRFETELSDPATPYIRAREGHSVPDVRLSNVRVRFPSAIPSLIYATAPANWPAIERDGIRPRLPPLLVPNPSNPNFIYFAHYMANLSPPTLSHLPSNALQLHITINVPAAMKAGIKFYATNTNQIISTGFINSTIPTQFFKDVSVVSVKCERLTTVY